ncbi:hypothetical protein HMPREF9080_00014 [Cardiobacterium valvarum F0432]|uniref:Uncharacterized protein n=1 Tax=Cardiobacterium valvarum F0432 TaxID=797473 RepID=G9ZB92_9GAMM|nr:hypothetical protein HMPREF9080_00014 [Cardiobacterium valvarum F0432]
MRAAGGIKTRLRRANQYLRRLARHQRSLRQGSTNYRERRRRVAKGRAVNYSITR